MEQSGNEQKSSALAIASLGLGIAGALAIPGSIALGALVPALGFVELFRGLVMPLGLAAIICGYLYRRGNPEAPMAALRISRIGMILGTATMVLTILIIVIVFIIFLPMLFAG